MMSKGAWVFLVILIGVLIFKFATGKRSPEQVNSMQEAVSSGGLLLDVRSTREFSSHHLEGAVNIPVSELGSRLDELGDKERSIVVYCASGARSKAASKLLGEKGFTRVQDLGSWRNWGQ